MTNNNLKSLNVYTDDLVATDPRVRPVHRTFKVLKMSQNSDGTIIIQTTEEHTISDGELVNVLDTSDGVHPFWRATKCAEDTMVLVPLFAKTASKNVKRIGFVSNRQLLYVLGPNQTISFKAIATKGTGRDWIKWSPCWSYYRPLFRDNTVDRTKTLTAAQANEIKQSCPKQVFDIEWVRD
jgi:hypothetical protein